MLQWRRFQFFDTRTLEIADEDGSPSSSNNLEIQAVCAASGRSQIYLGDALGVVHIINRSLDVAQFQAHDTLMHIYRASAQNILLTVGLDLGSDLPPASIKFWRLDSAAVDPVLAKQIRIFASPKLEQGPVTCIAVQDNLTHLAVGLGNGAVIVFAGDLLRGRYKTFLLRRSGPCITSVHFVSDDTLFMTTTSSVSSFQIQQDGFPELIIDQSNGCDMLCSVVNDAGQLAVGRPEGIFFFGSDDVGPCYGFESAKRFLHRFHSYLIVVSDNKNSSHKNDVTIFDLKHKLVAFSGVFDQISHVLCEWGCVIICQKQSPIKLVELHECDLTAKMDILFKRNLYTIAISLATSQPLDQSYIMEIIQRHGDHLYSKGDYQGAIREYIDTITPGVAHIEPSYVIRKFLNARLAEHLTAYLEALHANNCASKLHTTLLLNCFTRANLDDKLTAFLSNISSLKFDVDNAIQVCTSAGYLDHALQLAIQNKKIDSSIKILIMMDDYAAVVKYIAHLSFNQAEACLKQHGYLLFERAPTETVELLHRMCTNFADAGENISRANPEEFIHLFVGKPAALQNFLQSVVAQNPNASSTVYTTLLELYLRDRESGNEEVILDLLATRQTKYDPELALVLTKRYGFTPGVLFLYRKLNLYVDILEHHIQFEAVDAIIETCQTYGTVEPNLWLRALSFFASSTQHAQHPDSIRHVLLNIHQSRLLPSLMVIQMLSKNDTIPLSIVKDFILKSLAYDQSILDDDRRQIEEYRTETAQIKQRIHQLETQAISFQTSTCSVCDTLLSEPPVVHFLCMHSFHDRCIENSVAMQCPLCYPNYQKMTEIDSAMKSSANDHEAFFHKIQDAEDGFAAVAEYFGRGIIGNRVPTRNQIPLPTPELLKHFH
uniref:Vacuolar protein sorting-associated protein 11 homolog n=1 Tax=Spongospora subterranea TaxID=70186 RepID=A0A0H5R5Y6_9EUKA|eukprot:CRZ09533.1 hypothetical protein [Spongospora subterranea]